MRRLLRGARDLPESIEPKRDLWPGIAERLSGESEAPTPAIHGKILSWFRPGERRLGLLAAAAVLLIALFVGRQMGNDDRLAGGTEPDVAGESLDRGTQDPAADYASIDPTVLSTIAVLDAECREGDVQVALMQGRTADLEAPSGLGKVVEGLRIIDRAIDEAKTAWAANPHSPHLARMVMAAYRAKTSLQRQAAGLPYPS